MRSQLFYDKGMCNLICEILGYIIYGVVGYIVSYNQIVILIVLMRNFFMLLIIGCQIINVRLSVQDLVDDILFVKMFLKILILFDQRDNYIFWQELGNCV